MTTIKKVEDLTLDEIKEQMALYQRLYYHRTKGDPETKANRNESRRRWYNKKRQRERRRRKKNKVVVMNLLEITKTCVNTKKM